MVRHERMDGRQRRELWGASGFESIDRFTHVGIAPDRRLKQAHVLQAVADRVVSVVVQRVHGSPNGHRWLCRHYLRAGHCSHQSGVGIRTDLIDQADGQSAAGRHASPGQHLIQFTPKPGRHVVQCVRLIQLQMCNALTDGECKVVHGRGEVRPKGPRRRDKPWCPRPGSNRYAPYAGKRRILSPQCLPISPLGRERVRVCLIVTAIAPMLEGGPELASSPVDTGVWTADTAATAARGDQKTGGAAQSRTGLIGFAIRCITALLPRLKTCFGSCKRHFGAVCLADTTQEKREAVLPFCKPGAGKESRTLDLNLGKVALYQLSYSRVSFAV